MIVRFAAGAGAVRLKEGIEKLFDVDADLRLDYEDAVFRSLRFRRLHFEVPEIFHFIHIPNTVTVGAAVNAPKSIENPAGR